MKHIGKLSLVIIVLAVAVLAGCPKRVQETAEAMRVAKDAQDGTFTVKGEDGKVTKVETKGEGSEGTVTVQTGEGTTKAEYGKETVKESDIGVAFYPGAQVDMGSKTSAEKGQYAQVMLTTTDPMDKVAKFYKDKYEKGNTVLQQADNLMITMQTGEGAGKMIMISSQDGKTQIVITQASGQ